MILAEEVVSRGLRDGFLLPSSNRLRRDAQSAMRSSKPNHQEIQPAMFGDAAKSHRIVASM